MDTENSFVYLICQAKLGDQGAMDCLAETVRQRVYGYIYRLTLNHDLAQDLLQETLLKMVESIRDLEHPEGFWCWLFRTALGNVQHYYRDQVREQQIALSAMSRQRMSDYLAERHDDGLNHVMRQELSETILRAMGQLRLTYRNVLMLRCYEQMSFAQIGEMIGCKELRARVLFFRAKRSLHRQLTRRGFSKGLLLTALGLFGVLTAPAEGAPAAAAVTASSLQTGPVAAFTAVAGAPSTIAAVVTIAGAGLTLTMEQFVYVAIFGFLALLLFVIALYLS